MNQAQIVKQRKRINAGLLTVFVALLVWVVIEFWAEIQHAYRKAQPLTAQRIYIQRDKESIQFDYQNGQWQTISPYRDKASQTVIQALLDQLKNGCRAIDAVPKRMPQIYATISVDNKKYAVGELNHASDQVYVKSDEGWMLCDKLIAAMALAPAIHFIDKQLYSGALTRIAGDFGELTDFTGIDLSVMDIAPAEKQTLPDTAKATLTFYADDQRSYTAFFSEDGEHLLLFDDKKSLIYVLPANRKISAIMGL